MSLFADDMILNVEKPKDSTKKLLEKLQDTKVIYRNLLHCYTLIQRNQESNPIYNCIQKNKIPMNKSTYGNQRAVLWKLEDIDGRNQR